jgi:hypothetical protein
MTNMNWQKRTIAAFTLTLSAIALPSIAQAATLTFDDLSSPGPYMGSYKDMPSNYAGFTWNDFSYDSTPPEYTGYINGVVSPTTILFNTAARPAAISRPQTFDFTRAYLTAAWSNGLNILVQGFAGTTQTYSRTVTVNTDRPTLINFDFLGVDRVLFTSSGGVDAGYSDGSGTHFVLDNLTFAAPEVTQAAAVPEPTTMLGLGLAGAGLAAVRRRVRG